MVRRSIAITGYHTGFTVHTILACFCTGMTAVGNRNWNKFFGVFLQVFCCVFLNFLFEHLRIHSRRLSSLFMHDYRGLLQNNNEIPFKFKRNYEIDIQLKNIANS